MAPEKGLMSYKNKKKIVALNSHACNIFQVYDAHLLPGHNVLKAMNLVAGSTVGVFKCDIGTVYAAPGKSSSFITDRQRICEKVMFSEVLSVHAGEVGYPWYQVLSGFRVSVVPSPFLGSRVSRG